ncbi:MAG TPA: Ig-like domain-containing protein [Gaiellaceae bacterium]|nr:Ig-like domain-containing protein [Gaiellaceae bacterium]
MFDAAATDFHIYRLDTATQTWTNTGTLVDERTLSRSDALWDGTHLYIATAGTNATLATHGPRILRYSYSAATKSFTIDPGFPVALAPGVGQTATAGMEGIVIAKDTAGTVWATYVQTGRVWVSHSAADEATWVTPFVLPVPNSDNLTSLEDVAIVSYSGKIGIMFSNQTVSIYAFAIHTDGAADTVWQSTIANEGALEIDNHINMKALQGDPAGQVFALVKTSHTVATEPLYRLLVLHADGTWTNSVFTTVADNVTRAQLVIDTENRQLIGFASAPCCSGGAIFYKKTSLDNPSFPAGVGTPLIQSTADPKINNPTSTKQPVNGTTNFVTFASDDSTDRYLHSYLALDVTAPQTTITTAPANPSNSTSASFDFASNEAGSTFQCALDGAAFSACTSPVSFTTLADGSHTFQVKATDATGNTDATPASFTWTVDRVAPNTTITSTPANPSNSSSASFAFTSSETGSTFACTLDGAPFSACTSPKSYTALADGSHTFQVRATDAAGNTDATPASFTWTIATTAPETTITSTPPNPSNSSSASFAFTSTAAGATFACSLDAAAFAACTSPKTYTALADGSHTFQVRATAGASTDPTPASFTWTIDTIAPNTTITSTPPNPSASSSASFAFTSTETGSTFTCSLDGAAFSACTSPQSYTALADGSHTFQVRARDAAGNVDATPASFTWTVQTAAPDTTITSTPPNPSASSSASFAFTSSATGATFACSLDAAPFAACTSPKSYTALADGSHTFQVRSSDAAGTTDPTPASFTWTVDTVAPETTITTTPPNPSASSTASFAFTSSESGSTFDCSLDGGAFVACSSPAGYSGLADGSHTFAVRARDAAGNTDVTPASFTWTVTLATPGDLFVDGFESGDFSAWTRVKTAIEGTAVVQTALAAGGTHAAELAETATAGSLAFVQKDFATAQTDLTVRGDFRVLQEGAVGGNVPIFRLFDPAGVRILSLYRQNQDFDKIRLTQSGIGVTTTGRLPLNTWGHFELHVTSAGTGASTIEVKLDGALVYTTTTASLGTAGVLTMQIGNNTGGQTFRLVADSISATGTSAPDTSITAKPPDPSTSSSASFSFASTAPAATFTCSLDGAPFSSCTSPQSYTGLADGSHTFSVRSTSASGTDATPATFTWTVDTTAPTVTAVTPADGATGVTAATNVDAVFSEAMNAATLSSTTFKLTRDGATAPVTAAVTYDPVSRTATLDPDAALVGGAVYHANVKGGAGGTADAAGNPLAVDRSWTFTVSAALDTTPPETTITSGPNGSTAESTAAFAFSANEVDATFACSLDGAPFSSCSSPQSYTGLAVGSHTFMVRATDVAGNADATPASRTWSVVTGLFNDGFESGDFSAWTLAKVGADGSAVVQTTTVKAGTFAAELAETATTGSRAFVQKTLAAAQTDLTVSGDFQILQEGAAGGNVPIFRLFDPAGVRLLSLYRQNQDLDKIRVTQSGIGVTTTGRLPLNTWGHFDLHVITAGAGASTIEVKLDGVLVYTTTTASLGTTGVLTLEIGNDTVAQTFRLVADSISAKGASASAPDTSITASPPNPSTSSSASFSFNSTDAAATFACSLDGSAFSSCTSPKSYTALADGSHTFRVQSTGAAGTDPSPASFTWTIDTTTPTVTAVTPANGATGVSAAANVDAVFSEAMNAATLSATTFTLTRDGAAAPVSAVVSYDPATRTATLNPAADLEANALYHATVKGGAGGAADAAGNPLAADRSWLFTVGGPADVTPPDTTITASPPNSSGSAAASFSFASSEAGSTFQCKLDGGVFSACTSPVSFAGLADGSHTFQVKATDAAGNTDLSPALFTWTVDTIAPDTTIVTGPPNPSASSSASFSFVSTEPGGSFACSLDGAPFSPCAPPKSYTALTEGSHTFSVRATDAAGNTDATPATGTWTVTLAVVFSDGFESGNFSAWTLVKLGKGGTAVVQTTLVKSGTHAAEIAETSAGGSRASVDKSLAQAATHFTVSGDFQILQEGAAGGNVPIFRLFDAAGTRLVSLHRQNLAGNEIRVAHSGTEVASTGRLPLNTWGHFDLHVITAGAGASTIEVKLDGIVVYTTTTASLGTAGVLKFQIGNDTVAQAFRLVADDIAVRAG